MGVMNAYGREFEFEDGTPDDVVQKRIQNWMSKNAPGELSPDESKPEQAQLAAESKPGLGMRILNAMMSPAIQQPPDHPAPEGNLGTHLMKGPERMSDPNFWRTAAQGAFPAADEAIAGGRALFGTPYDQALAEERQGLKDYKDKYGEADALGTELLGAIPTSLMGVGAARTAAKLTPRLAALAAAHPWLASALGGAGIGAVQGFSAGEGQEDRLQNAAAMAGLTGVLGPATLAGAKGVEKVGSWLNHDNKVANYLRSRIAKDRATQLAGKPGVPMSGSDIDINDPAFVGAAMKDLRGGMREQQGLNTRPMVADLLPNTTEALVNRPSQGGERLADSLVRRQYDKNLPEDAARGLGQSGRVEDAFDLAFGPDIFKGTDEALLASRNANADKLRAPAYAQNIRDRDLNGALDNPYVQDAWKDAVKKAESEGRSIGVQNPVSGQYNRWNVQFLHNLKTSMDDAASAAADAGKHDLARTIGNARDKLNNAVKEASPEFKAYMQQFGEDSGLMAALKKGREETFPRGSVDTSKKPVMDAAEIKAYLADPNIPDAQKDLFKIGAARNLREQVLGSSTKKFTHNWADFLSNPKMEENVGALLTDKMGSWDLFRAQMNKESQNYKNASKALMNSRTAARQELQKELEASPMGSFAAAATNPGSFGTAKVLFNALAKKLEASERTATRASDILGRSGSRGNQQSLAEIEALLRKQDARTARHNTAQAYAPYVAAYSYPYRER
jgi:hypothetical protein